MKNNFLYLILSLLLLFSIACKNSKITSEQLEKSTTSETNFSISTAANSWVVDNPEATDRVISKEGIKNWTDSKDKIRTYFKTTATGKINIALNAKFSVETKLKITLGNTTKSIDFKATENNTKHALGTFEIDTIGYNYIEFEGVSKKGANFGEITEVVIDNSWSSKISYVKPDWSYWGRRGPSVHLTFKEPANKNITWFYNEITVPKGNDPIGSYFMANGFSSGYFGMQVNSETERRILFSVWSAYDTQDPKQIPKEYTVKPLGSSDGVVVGEFGNEGSGAQSYFVYNWKPDTTYKFLLKGESKADNSIDYTAYFYIPETQNWKLIASFRRPFPTGKHLTRLHSFLENFVTSSGAISRKVEYTNQWVYDTENTWIEMTSALFTIDNTGASGVRFDYDGGSENASFYLRNCGFFSDNQEPQTTFIRKPSGIPPSIDFSQLEIPKIPVEVSHNFLDRSTWKITAYSSQEDQGGEGKTGLSTDILDGNNQTFWHSSWSKGKTAKVPHYITVDMGAIKKVDGFRFIQRQSLQRAVATIELQVSNDAITWESLGEFNLRNVTSNQDINLLNSKTFRYFKWISKASHDGTNYAALAEIKPYNFM